MKFHDGEPFDAAAAKYSLERHMNMKGSFRKPELAAVDTVEVVDPLTVKLNLKQPFSPLLAQLTDRAGMMVSPKAAEAAGDKFALKPVCAGPYKFVERIPQDKIVVEKFADYWNKDHVFLDKITYLPIVESTVRLANLRSGGLDMMERLLATDIKTVRDDPKLRLSKAVSLGFWALLVNVANGPKADNPLGKDARVRQAFDLSIDREALNQVVFNGEFVPGNQWVNPQSPWYHEGVPDPQARRRQGQGTHEGGGRHRPAHDRLHGRQQPRNPRKSPRSCSRWWPRPVSTSRSGWSRRRPALKAAEDGDFQLYENQWSGRIDPDGNTVLYQTCGSPLNTGRYCDKEIDEWHREARASSDFATRKKVYEKIAAKFLPNGWMIYLYHPNYLIAHTARLENFKPDARRPDPRHGREAEVGRRTICCRPPAAPRRPWPCAWPPATALPRAICASASAMTPTCSTPRCRAPIPRASSLRPCATSCSTSTRRPTSSRSSPPVTRPRPTVSASPSSCGRA